MTTPDQLLKAARTSVSRYGPPSIDQVLDEIGEEFDNGAPADASLARELMKTCRDARGFDQMKEIGEIFEPLRDPAVILFHCQARIDTGEVKPSIRQLKRLLASLNGAQDNRPRSEALGLLGRAFKQEFVSSFGQADAERAAASLQTAFEYHKTGYDLDVAWHGANLAALAWRAEREGIELEASASAVGEKLLADLSGIAEPNAWQVSAQAQAYMAMGDWDMGQIRYREYAHKLRRIRGRKVAFDLFGDVRQLGEIWLADDTAGSPAKDIHDALNEEIAKAAVPGCTTADLDRFRDAMSTFGVDAGIELQAMVASGEIVTVQEICRVVANRRTVAKISNKDRVAIGTGFLMSGRPFGIEDPHAVLVTNSHVLSEVQDRENQVTPDSARVDFEAWDETGQSTFNVHKILWESPPGELDITIALVENLPTTAEVAMVNAPPERFMKPDGSSRNLGRVHPIGHPRGGPLSLSMAGNEVLDHNLHNGPLNVQRIHYRANTEQGSSGGPVFSPTGTVVAVHRAATRQMLDGTKLQFDPTYFANEGVSIQCIIARLSL